MKTSLVITVLNEGHAINLLLESIKNQKKVPDEIIIVDGGSSDATVRIIRTFIQENKILGKHFKLYYKPGNRSLGRNYGVEHAHSDIILFTDAGCILDFEWTEKISEPFQNKEVDVVSGYYQGQTENNLQKALVPYVLVMPDKIDKKIFLPATRSMAIKKSVFEELGGFDEKLSHNEDFAFAKKLEKEGKTIAFARQAIVYWIPPETLFQSLKMFYRFAYGDIEARIIRPKVLFIYARYFIWIGLLINATLYHSVICYWLFVISLLLYIAWAIKKNYKYVHNPSAFFYLPLLQFDSDLAIIYGSTKGFWKLVFRHSS